MLHILGMIGKGIGIALLCILIVLLVLLLSILFVPIRYRLDGSKEETGKPAGSARLCWLFHMISAFAIWEGTLHYGMKICGISVYDNLRKAEKEKKPRKRRKEKARKKKKNRKEKSKREDTKNRNQEENTEEALRETAGEAVTKTEPTKAEPEECKKAEKTVWKQTEPLPKTEPEEIIKPVSGQETERKETAFSLFVRKVKAFCRKIKAFFDMLARLIRKFMELPHKINEKINHWRETVGKFTAFLQRDDLQRAFDLCKKQLFYVWKDIRPKTVRADICFGFDDPSVTGQILAAAGMFYPVLGKNIVLRPDFEEAVLSGRIAVKGRITVFVLLRTAWILYFDKDIKRLIRIWKKEETLDGRQ